MAVCWGASLRPVLPAAQRVQVEEGVWEMEGGGGAGANGIVSSDSPVRSVGGACY